MSAEPAIRSNHVAVIGVGAVGGPLARGLAQTKALDLIDPGVFKQESVQTQAALPEHVGRNKAEILAEMLARTSAASVRGIDLPVQALGRDWFIDHRYDAVFLAVDNLAAERAASALVAPAGIPIIHAAIEPTSLLTQVRVLANRSDDGPCLECMFSGHERDLADSGARFSCETGLPVPFGPPTRSPPSLGPLTAHMAILLWLRLQQDSEGTADREFSYCALAHSSFVTPIRRKEVCICDHRKWRRMTSDQPLDSLTPQQILKMVGSAANASISIAGLRAADRWSCGCSTKPRFVSAVATTTSCPRCGRGVVPDPLHRFERLPISDLPPAEPIGRSAGAPIQSILLDDGAQQFLLQTGEAHE